MNLNLPRVALCAALIATLGACGSGGGSSDTGSGLSSTPPPQTTQMAMIISDASSDDWATVGVKIMSIALMPQGGGSPVTVYTAPATPPMVTATGTAPPAWMPLGT